MSLYLIISVFVFLGIQAVYTALRNVHIDLEDISRVHISRNGSSIALPFRGALSDQSFNNNTDDEAQQFVSPSNVTYFNSTTVSNDTSTSKELAEDDSFIVIDTCDESLKRDKFLERDNDLEFNLNNTSEIRQPLNFSSTEEDDFNVIDTNDDSSEHDESLERDNDLKFNLNNTSETRQQPNSNSNDDESLEDSDIDEVEVKEDKTFNKCAAMEGKGVYHYPHPTNGRSFFWCNNGVASLFECPGNLHFNPDLMVCDWKHSDV